MDTLNLKQHAKEIIEELNNQNITKEEAEVILKELDYIISDYCTKKYYDHKKAEKYAVDIAKRFEASGYTWNDVEQMKSILKEESSEGLESYKARKFKSLENGN